MRSSSGSMVRRDLPSFSETICLVHLYADLPHCFNVSNVKIEREDKRLEASLVDEIIETEGLEFNGLKVEPNDVEDVVVGLLVELLFVSSN